MALLPTLLREQGTGLHEPQGEPGECLGPAAAGERGTGEGERQQGLRVSWRRMLAAWQGEGRQVRSEGTAGIWGWWPAQAWG